MYIGLGQEEVVVEQPKAASNDELLTSLAALVDPIAQATSKAVEIKMRTDVNEARIKAGLDPLPPPGVALPQVPEEKAISTSSLLLGLMLVGGLLYLISQNK